MRCHWIVSILSTLVSMGVLVIVVGQYQMLLMLNEELDQLQVDSERLDNQFKNKEFFKGTVERLVTEGTKGSTELEGAVGKLTPEMEKKKTDNDACQAAKKTISDEVGGMEKQHTETEATFKTESDAWNKEIETLKAQVAEISPICAHVKNDTTAEKLCSKKPDANPAGQDPAVKSQ